ncbi:MAG: D-glycero-beta-D-manno-heptose-7-phosphate kinase [Candidatus Eisenbacteria bacterium]|nr:D-glycero-beta-D-manno-heptose-7-phosphate kinase [Candidatus Eisenbacteria bacterium]
MTEAIRNVERIRERIRRFQGKRFLVVGDVMLDRYVYGDVSRISPEAPVPVVRVLRQEERLGGAANVANNLLALGAEATICGVTGDDEDGEVLRWAFSENGLDPSALVTAAGRPTTRKTRIIGNHQQVVRIDTETDEPVEDAAGEGVAAAIRERIDGVDGVILSDYGKGVVTEKIIRLVVGLSGARGNIFVDPKVKHFSNYRGVSLVTPNASEAGMAAGEKIVDEASLLRVGKRLLNMLPGTSLLITRGEKGMSLFEPAGRITHIPTVARAVYDVTGAGDTVISVFAVAVAAGADKREAAIIANHAAGEVIMQPGAAVITAERLLELFEEEE